MTSPVLIPAGHALLAADFDAYENLTGAWSTWTPTLTNITLGAGTVTARYRRVGQTVDFHFKFVLGAGSAVGTSPEFTPPATPHASYVNFRDIMSYSVTLIDNTTNAFPACLQMTGASFRFRYFDTAAALAITNVSATAPFTWSAANADELIASGTYEAA